MTLITSLKLPAVVPMCSMRGGAGIPFANDATEVTYSLVLKGDIAGDVSASTVSPFL